MGKKGFDDLFYANVSAPVCVILLIDTHSRARGGTTD